MRKCVSFFVCAAAALALAPAAGAQVFNHLAVGAGAGSDRVSFELAAPLGKHVQVRAGFGSAFGIKFHGERIYLSPLVDDDILSYPGADDLELYAPFDLRFCRNDARLLFNLYPSARSSFHFTVGAYIGSPVLARMTLDTSDFPAEIVDNGLLKLDGQEIRIQNGTADGWVETGNAFRPYVGLGFGRPVRETRRVTFSVDMGVTCQGALAAYVAGKDADIDLLTPLEADGGLEERELLHGLVSFCPTINLHLYVRLF